MIVLVCTSEKEIVDIMVVPEGFWDYTPGHYSDRSVLYSWLGPYAVEKRVLNSGEPIPYKCRRFGRITLQYKPAVRL